MRNRIVEIADRPARLRIERRQLVLDLAEEDDRPAETARVPVEDIAVLVLAHQQISLTQPVLASLTAQGAAVVVSDAARMPCGLILPLAAHGTQALKMRAQIALSKPKAKRLWQQIVKAKIAGQAAVLAGRGLSGTHLRLLVSRVRSGDPDNIEAQAARRYWRPLMGEGFRRDRELPGCNALLNYGYAVLRAIVSRAITAAGLHPTFGLHHHNRGNAFALADDLMEPLRPHVDRAVAELLDAAPELADDEDGLSTTARRRIAAVLTSSVCISGEQRTLIDAAARMAQSLAAVICGEDGAELLLPEPPAVQADPKSSPRTTPAAETRNAAG